MTYRDHAKVRPDRRLGKIEESTHTPTTSEHTSCNVIVTLYIGLPSLKGSRMLHNEERRWCNTEGEIHTHYSKPYSKDETHSECMWCVCALWNDLHFRSKKLQRRVRKSEDRMNHHTQTHSHTTQQEEETARPLVPCTSRVSQRCTCKVDRWFTPNQTW